MKFSTSQLKSHFRLAFALFLLTTVSQTVLAQNVSPAIMQQVSAELQKRGLSESEVRTRLLQNGIDLENVPPTELPQYQTRVTAILDEMQAEKKNAAAAQQPININVAAPATPATTSPAVNATDVPAKKVATEQEAVAEAQQRVIQKETAKQTNNIYGHSLFTDQSLEVFRTTDGAQAPDTYVLGDGDEIRITIFGASQTDIQQRVSPDGSIQPTGVAKIFLKGLTLAQARQVIRERLSLAYSFRADQIAVSIVTARTIMVNVFGETKITGGFTISALNSAINALSAAGGPTAIGSVRSIQHIRGNTRKNIDLYSFMNDPAAQYKFDLQNNDILFVPVIKGLVTIEGAVNRPMDYEMLPNETLTDLISFAGGLKMDAYPEFVQIKRFVNGEERLLEWNLDEVRSGKVIVPLMNGDKVTIKSISKPMDQYVEISGSVYYPGRFDLSSNPTLRTLVENAKPNYNAKTDILFVERIRPDETVEVLTVPFPGKQSSTPDFKLQPRDRVKILDQATYRDVETISVNGHVRTPFSKSFALTDRLTISQAIELAGGLKTSAYPVAYIFRKNLINPVEVSYIPVNLENDLRKELQPGDQLNVYDNTTYSNIGEVKVYGAVKNPKGLTYDPTLSITDLLTNAGGFTTGAAFNRVEIFRTVLSSTEPVKLQLITIEVDSAYQVVNPADFKLQPYDQVVVRLTPEFTMGRVVEINGQVRYPGSYVLESKQTTLSDVIKMAGGLLDDADPYGGMFFRTYKERGNITLNVRKAINHPENLKHNPILFEGDVININRLENTVTILENGTRMAQYNINPHDDKKNIVFQGGKSAAWYVRNYAGGFQKEADRNSITVTLPNNQMRSTKKFIGLRNYPTVESGSTITLMMKPPKEEKTAKERKPVDWNGIWSTTLSATTTAVTLFVLINQLKPAQ